MTTAPKSTDWSDADLEVLRGIAIGLGGKPEHLLSVMYSESGASTRALNDNPKTKPVDDRYNAVGLIQFMPATLKLLGFGTGLGPRERAEAFRGLTVAEQLHFVRRYYTPHRGKLGTRVAWYLATFLPAYLSHADEPNYVLADKYKTGTFSGAVYAANASFDHDRDLKIQVRELDEAIERNAKGARWTELVTRLTGVPPLPVPAQPPARQLNVSTWLGAQTALQRLGFYRGKLDGLWGPLSQAATLAFQRANGIDPVGVYGPKTRAALQAIVDGGGAPAPAA